MKKLSIAWFIILTGCATTYQKGAKSEYIGNGLYEIKTAGNEKTESDTIRSFIYHKAFDVCVEKDKGYVMAEPLMAINSFETNFWGQMQNKESFRLVVKCEGPVDQELVNKYGRMPASK